MADWVLILNKCNHHPQVSFIILMAVGIVLQRSYLVHQKTLFWWVKIKSYKMPIWAIDRIKNDACGKNARRLGLKTPCAVIDQCQDCRGQSRMCRAEMKNSISSVEQRSLLCFFSQRRLGILTIKNSRRKYLRLLFLTHITRTTAG